jgi:hypothetical protein
MSDLTDLIEEMKELGNEIDALDEQKKPLQKRYDELRLELIPSSMAEEDITSMTGGFGRCTLTSDLYVSAPNKPALHEWLESSGNGDLIQPTVNAQTLKAFVKEQMKNENELPDGLLKVTPFSRAVIYVK